MKISEAVQEYLSWKKSLGLRYASIDSFLVSFSRFVHDCPVSTITRARVSAFLNRTKTSNSTWLQNYDKLSRFFRHLQISGELKTWPMPAAVQRQPITFIPYIYSRSEIQRLTRATAFWDTGRPKRLDAATFKHCCYFSTEQARMSARH